MFGVDDGEEPPPDVCGHRVELKELIFGAVDAAVVSSSLELHSTHPIGPNFYLEKRVQSPVYQQIFLRRAELEPVVPCRRKLLRSCLLLSRWS